MIQAFREIRLPVDLRGEKQEFVLPFDMILLERVEDTLIKCEAAKWNWFRQKREKTVRDAYREFCEHYLPDDFPYDLADPTFCAVFFTHAKNELADSIVQFEKMVSSTQESEEPTDPKTPEKDAEKSE